MRNLYFFMFKIKFNPFFFLLKIKACDACNTNYYDFNTTKIAYYRCEPLTRFFTALKRGECDYLKRWTWLPTIESINVGCVCNRVFNDRRLNY